MKKHIITISLDYLNIKEMYSDEKISIKEFYYLKYLDNSDLAYKFQYLVRTIWNRDIYSARKYYYGLPLKLPLYKFFINKNYYYLKFIDFFYSLKLTLIYS